MSITMIICTAVVAGLTALGLTRWMRRVAKVNSVWLAHYLHVPLAAALGAGAALLADNWAELVGYTLLGIGCALLVVVDLAAMRLLKALGCGAAMMGIYLVMALVRRGQLGMGDVKLGGVLGLFLGWLGWGEALLGMLAAFILSAVVGLAMVWYLKLTTKQMFPFGPYMVAGAVVGAAVGSSFLAI